VLSAGPRKIAFARELGGWPICVPKAKRLRGSKAHGVAYEKRVAKEVCRLLPGTRWGQWYEYGESGRTRFCQVDLVRVSPTSVVVFECKLSNVEEALRQLEEVYKPVLACAYRLPILGVIVTKSVHRVPEELTLCASMSDVAQVLRADGEKVPVLHWLGVGRMA